jgi:outer membrane lipoprotein carrier protein
MMKKTGTILLALVLMLQLNAQTTNQDAKKILDDVSTKFKSFKTVNASFTYKVENAAGKH